jgi:hypothetical protein
VDDAVLYLLTMKVLCNPVDRDFDPVAARHYRSGPRTRMRTPPTPPSHGGYRIYQTANPEGARGPAKSNRRSSTARLFVPARAPGAFAGPTRHAVRYPLPVQLARLTTAAPKRSAEGVSSGRLRRLRPLRVGPGRRGRFKPSVTRMRRPVPEVSVRPGIIRGVYSRRTGVHPVGTAPRFNLPLYPPVRGSRPAGGGFKKACGSRTR